MPGIVEQLAAELVVDEGPRGRGGAQGSLDRHADALPPRFGPTARAARRRPIGSTRLPGPPMAAGNGEDRRVVGVALRRRHPRPVAPPQQPAVQRDAIRLGAAALGDLGHLDDAQRAAPAALARVRGDVIGSIGGQRAERSTRNRASDCTLRRSRASVRWAAQPRSRAALEDRPAPRPPRAAPPRISVIIAVRNGAATLQARPRQRPSSRPTPGRAASSWTAPRRTGRQAILERNGHGIASAWISEPDTGSSTPGTRRSTTSRATGSASSARTIDYHDATSWRRSPPPVADDGEHRVAVRRHRSAPVRWTPLERRDRDVDPQPPAAVPARRR